MTARDPSVHDRFLKDIATHAVEIVRDDAGMRHLRCRRPGTYCYGFDIVTYPDHLVMSGDMGSWVFSRLHDMFEFFRGGVRPDGSLAINRQYWAEKLVAINKGGFEEFDSDRFIARVDEAVAEWLRSETEAGEWISPEDENEPDYQKPAEMTADLQVLINDLKGGAYESGVRGEIMAFDALNEFKDPEGRISFPDAWEYNLRRYTFHFEWALYAIVWTIREYDRIKTQAQAVAS